MGRSGGLVDLSDRGGIFFWGGSCGRVEGVDSRVDSWSGVTDSLASW